VEYPEPREMDGANAPTAGPAAAPTAMWIASTRPATLRMPARALIGPLLSSAVIADIEDLWREGVACPDAKPIARPEPPQARNLFTPAGDPANLDPLPVQLADCHDAAFALLVVCRESAERLALFETTPEDRASLHALIAHGLKACRRTRVQPVMDPLAVCAWFESMDAERVAHLATEDPARARIVEQDMRDFARTIGADGIAAFLDSRTDTAGPLAASMVWQPEWPSIGWELVACTSAVRSGWADLAEHLRRVARRISRELHLGEEFEAALARELASLADVLPPGFRWSAAIEDALCAHAVQRIPEGQDVLGNSPAMRDVCARMVAWNFYGYAWAQPGALPVVERDRVREQRDTILADMERAFREGCRDLTPDQWAAVAPEMTKGLAAVRQILEDPWNPWAVFPVEPETLRFAKNGLSAFLSGDFFHGSDFSTPARLGEAASHRWISIALVNPTSLGIRPATAHRSRLVPWRQVSTGVFNTPWIVPFKP
jgi:hypothetical protein